MKERVAGGTVGPPAPVIPFVAVAAGHCSSPLAFSPKTIVLLVPSVIAGDRSRVAEAENAVHAGVRSGSRAGNFPAGSDSRA